MWASANIALPESMPPELFLEFVSAEVAPVIICTSVVTSLISQLSGPIKVPAAPKFQWRFAFPFSARPYTT